jgi:hypothetical protein
VEWCQRRIWPQFYPVLPGDGLKFVTAISTIEVGNALKADIERPGLKCREVPLSDIACSNRIELRHRPAFGHLVHSMRARPTPSCPAYPGVSCADDLVQVAIFDGQTVLPLPHARHQTVKPVEQRELHGTVTICLE